MCECEQCWNSHKINPARVGIATFPVVQDSKWKALKSTSEMLLSQKQPMPVNTQRELQAKLLRAAASPDPEAIPAGQQATRLPPEEGSRGLEVRVAGALSIAYTLMKVPWVLASCCLKSRPPFHPIRSPSSTQCLFSVGTNCILVPRGAVPVQPKLCAQRALPLPSCTASLPTSCCSHSARGLFRRSACTVRCWKERAFIRHCSILY